MGASSSPSRTLDRLGLVAVLALILGPLLAWLRLVPGIVGFATFALGGILALVVTILGVIRAIRGRGYGREVLVATLGLLVFVRPRRLRRRSDSAIRLHGLRGPEQPDLEPQPIHHNRVQCKPDEDQSQHGTDRRRSGFLYAPLNCARKPVRPFRGIADGN